MSDIFSIYVINWVTIIIFGTDYEVNTLKSKSPSFVIT